jgi:hypothetical protein
MSITITNGITIGPGIIIGNTVSFTVTPADITYNRQLYHGYSAYDSNGFTCDGNTDTYNGIIYNTTPELHATIVSAWGEAGMDTGNAYVWNVNFTTGGSIVARIAVNPDNITDTLAITPIDQADPRWQSGQIGTPLQAGTWTFPATFTPYIPTTQISNANDWC